MLVLTRRVGERIVIDGPSTVTIVAQGKGKVRLGIEAARGVKILREELIDQGGPGGSPGEGGAAGMAKDGLKSKLVAPKIAPGAFDGMKGNARI